MLHTDTWKSSRTNIPQPNKPPNRPVKTTRLEPDEATEKWKKIERERQIDHSSRTKGTQAATGRQD